MAEFQLLQFKGSCRLETLQVEACGVVRLTGWMVDETAPAAHLALTVDDREIVPEICYSVYRPDLARTRAFRSSFGGFVLEFLVPYCTPCLANLTVWLDGSKVFHLRQEFVVPHYRELLTTNQVLHRESIYGYGPPSPTVDPVVLALAQILPGPLLDFGCGSGRLVQEMRRSGTDAWGIEIDRPPIRNSLTDEVREFVTLYDGRFPIPYPDHSFSSVICTEVLEHIPEYEEALREITRVARRNVLITVPDMTAIPTLFPHGVVPWHLLESTHVNFFTPKSLEKVLKPHFTSVAFYKIHPVTINSSQFYTSVAACCHK